MAAGTRIMRLLSPAAALALLLSLTACTAIEDLFGDEYAPPCPEVSVLPEAATVTRFREGPGRDIIDEVFSGAIADVQMGCEHDIDEDTGEGSLSMAVAMMIEAERGAANRDRRAHYHYFVSLTDPSRKIIAKETFDLPTEFPGNHNRMVITDDPVSLEIPLQKGMTGANFRVVVGFQLTREDMEFNRIRRQGTR